MISVDLDKIVTAKGLQEHLASILYEVEEEEKVYVITKQGKPQAALVNVDYLQELTGQQKLPTREYDRYDQFATTTPPTESTIEPTTEMVKEPAPAPTAIVEPKPEPTPEPVPQTASAVINDLSQLTEAPLAENPNEDPYSVAEDEEQHIDLNGLPIKGQPDPTDGPANTTTPTDATRP